MNKKPKTEISSFMALKGLQRGVGISNEPFTAEYYCKLQYVQDQKKKKKTSICFNNQKLFRSNEIWFKKQCSKQNIKQKRFMVLFLSY